MKLITKVFFNKVNSFNAHTILGLNRFADQKQIKRAYYSLAKQYHPDSNPGQDTSEQFQRVTKAYQLLIKDAAQRATQSEYKKQSEQRGERGEEEPEDKMFKAYQAYKRKHGIHIDSFHKFREFFEDYMDQKKHPRAGKKQQHFQGIFEEGYNEQEEDQSSEDIEQGKHNRQRNKKLELFVEVHLSEEEARAGTDKRLKVYKKFICSVCHGQPRRKEVKCKKCNGSGVHISKNQIGFCWCCGGNRTVSRSDCSGCDGKGQVSRQAEQVIHIRPGIGNNQELIIKGKGHQHYSKGFFGDLIVSIRIKGSENEAHGAKFKKVGFNTYETIKISVIEAVLGTKLKYTTVWGEKTLPIRGGIQDGFIIKRNGQGYRKRSKDNGHHFITISIEIPIKLSEEQAQIYERIRQVYRAHHKQREI